MFQEFHIEQIPREQNIVADLLTNLAIHHGAVEQKTVILEYQNQLHIVKSSVEVNSSTITDGDIPSWNFFCTERVHMIKEKHKNCENELLNT